MQNSIKPLEIKSQLAKAPRTPPQFGVRAHTQSGESLWLGDPKATRAMIALMDMGAQIAGAASHYGGPAAFAELMSATHGLMFYFSQKQNQDWFEAFNFVNDAGHCENGLYALKANYKMADLNFDALKKFRSIESPLTGHGEAHLFPQGVLVSNGPLGSGLPQAQGLAIGDSLSGKKRVTICALSDGGAMEGEAREALAAIPGLARRQKLAPFICIVSDNRTKLSGRIESDAFSMEPTFSSLKALGWQVMSLEDGHHLQACMATIEEAINQVKLDPSQPIMIIARTVKGKGHKKSETSNSGGHGFSLKKAEELPAFLSEIYEGQEVPKEFMAWAEELKTFEAQFPKPAPFKFARPDYFGKDEKIQIGVSQALIEKRKAGLPVISISADLQGSTGVADFHKAYPEAAIDVGVAEANMISTAIGLSLAGYIPVVDTFAQFGVTKGALPLTMASLSKAPLIAIFSHTGFQDAADGASHQALSFFAQVSSIPHIEVFALTTSSEAEALIGQAIEDFAAKRAKGEVPPTRIFFLGRENFPKSFIAPSVGYQLGTAQIVFDNSKSFSKSVCIAASGSMVSEALEAAQILSEKQIGSLIFNPSCINKIDLVTLKAALAKSRVATTESGPSIARLITVEEHRSIGGMGEMICHALKLSGENFVIQSLAIANDFGQSAYSARELYKKHRLDSSAIVDAALKF
jgi:transketolase